MREGGGKRLQRERGGIEPNERHLGNRMQNVVRRGFGGMRVLRERGRGREEMQ